VQHIAVTVGPQDPPTAGEGSAEEARALAAALERTLPAREGIIRAIEVDPTLTARMEVRARDGVHALEIAKELYREAYVEATNRPVPPLETEHA